MSSMVLELILQAKDEASGALDKIKSGLGGVNVSAAAIGVAAVAGVGMLAKGLWDCAKAAGDEEIGIARLKAAVDASGTSYDDVSASIETYIAAATRKTAFDDGDQRDALARLTMTTGDYNTALGLMPLAMDLARAKGMELSAASELVGKVAAGNTSALTRYGIVLGEGATAQEALAAMQQKFGGQAEAYGNTFVGAQDKMGIALGNLKETIGTAVLPILTTFITKLADLATDMIPKVEQVMRDLQPVFETVWNAIKLVFDTVLPPLIALVKEVFGGIKTFLDEHGAAIQTVMQTAWDAIQNIVTTVTGVIKGIIDAWTAALNGDWQGVWDAIQGIVETVWNGIQTHIGLVLGALQTLIGGAVDGIRTTMGNGWNTIYERARDSFNTIKTAIMTPLNEAKGLIDGIISGIIAAWQRLGSFHIPLPHFRAGTRDVNVAGISFPIPDIGIDWYGKGLAPTVFNRPTLIGVGENGPETVSVTPADKGGGAGIAFTYNAYGPSAGRLEAEQMLRALEFKRRWSVA